MNNSIKKQIAELVKDLPAMYSKSDTEMREYFGSQLNAMGKKQKNGEPYSAAKKYIMKVAKATDHHAEAERNFNEGGMPRVHAYCDQIRGVNTEHSEKDQIINMLKGAFPPRESIFDKK